MIAGVILAILLLIAPAARAQTPAISTTLDAETLRDLPTTDNLFSVLETTQPSIVSDRFSESGLYVGQPARLGSFFSSSTETVFRLGDVDLSDPSGSGQPLLLPDLTLWQRVDVATGLTPIESGAPGLAVTFEPRRPAARWTRTISGSQFGSTEPARPGVPPIVRPDRWSRVSASASGPLLGDAQGITRLAGYFAGSATRGDQFFRSEAKAASASASSGFALLTFTPSDRTAIETIGWVQQSEYPFEPRITFGGETGRTEDHAAHLQATWERHAPDARRWRLFASYTRRDRTPKYEVTPGVTLERLLDGPVSNLASLSATAVSRWSAGVRTLPAVTTTPRRHSLDAGLEFGGARQRAFSFFSGLAGELVDGTPARIWRFTAPASDSVRHETTLTGFLMERIALAPRLRLDAGVRVETVSGSADGGSGDLSWRSLLPRAGLEWTIVRSWETRAFVGVGRSAYRLPLDLLAIGDPAAPTADVFQWTAAGQPLSASLGALVARTGPGTGGDPQFSRIDSNVKRPVTDEFVIGLESHLGRPLRLRVAGFARRERNPLALVNVGAPLSAYSVVSVADTGIDLFGTEDDYLLPVYNRLPSSFGQDRYVLTNPEPADVQEATSKSFEISGELRTSRLTIFGGATASMANGAAANRGFGPLENDQSRIGELLVNPNATTFARGRLFVDRAYTIKLSGVVRLPFDIRLGAIVRYQDGQPFSRLVVLSTLNQGAEAVRAFPNGGSRFTFTETLDARLQKGFGAGGERFVLVVDAFNVLKMANEVEERVVTGEHYRDVTAVQPPRTLHVGLRLSF